MRHSFELIVHLFGGIRGVYLEGKTIESPLQFNVSYALLMDPQQQQHCSTNFLRWSAHVVQCEHSFFALSVNFLQSISAGVRVCEIVARDLIIFIMLSRAWCHRTESKLHFSIFMQHKHAVIACACINAVNAARKVVNRRMHREVWKWAGDEEKLINVRWKRDSDIYRRFSSLVPWMKMMCECS